MNQLFVLRSLHLVHSRKKFCFVKRSKYKATAAYSKTENNRSNALPELTARVFGSVFWMPADKSSIAISKVKPNLWSRWAIYHYTLVVSKKPVFQNFERIYFQRFKIMYLSLFTIVPPSQRTSLCRMTFFCISAWIVLRRARNCCSTRRSHHRKILLPVYLVPKIRPQVYHHCVPLSY